MFAHALLFITVIFAFGSVVWQNLPYHSLVKDDILYAYDYIIVGGGTAGSVLASRLSEAEGISVLLVEAGEEPNSKNVLEIPAMSSEHQRSFMDWSYKIEPQRHACQAFDDQQIYWPRGKMLGGSDSFGHLVYVRGNPRDFDEWAVDGCKGWSYEDVLPYFIKSENNKNAYYKQSDYHGDSGPLSVSDMATTQIAEKFIGAAKELNFDRLDINGPKQLGVSLLQGTTSWGRRDGVIHSFLHPSMGRDNLHVATKALVHKVLFKGNQATGVELSWNQTIRHVRARREVILCAGAIETPHILMLSGIGPRRHLESLGIQVVSDLPVGQNLQDQISILGLEFTIISKIATTERKSKSLWTLFDYLLFGRGWPVEKTTHSLHSNNRLSSKPLLELNCYPPKGVLTSSGFEATGFFPSGRQPPNSGRPALQLMLFNSLVGSVMSEDRLRTIKSRLNMNHKVFNALFKDMMYEEGFTIYPVLLHPKSRGEITLNSTSPIDPPIIDPRYLEDPEDMKTLLEGIRLTERLIATREMSSVGASLTARRHPNCEGRDRPSDEYWSCFIEQNTFTMNHAVGTCKMGAAGDPTTVLDPQLRVKGVKKLRVVDASVLPDLPSGNINAVVVMAAEKAADLILGRVSVRKFGQKETHEEWHERIHKRDEL